MAGIYLHIPFCRQACHYCNFHFSTSLKRKNDFVVALLKEMERQQHYIGKDLVDTVYFGGGTPSLLTEEELRMILDRLQATFVIDPGAEITLEANPDDVTQPGKLPSWKRAGINRLSIGIQSFFSADLGWMNRAHTAGQALDSITMARQEGFANISADLIYGTPTLTDRHWEMNVRQAIDLGIPHLSCYALTVEPRTALDKMIRQQKMAAVDPDAQARQFLLLMDWLEQAGYEHYEISNFARPGLRSRHNSSYWQGKSYLGLGPSAHSFNGGSRQWNVANNALYIDKLLGAEADGVFDAGGPGGGAAGSGDGAVAGGLFEKEVLTPVQQLNEYIMISLRTMEGCDLRQVSERFGDAAAQQLKKRAQRYALEGTMTVTERLILTKEGKLLADGIAADLFFE